MSGARWFNTCPKCNLRRGWTGELSSDPGCPQCSPKKPGLTVAADELDDEVLSAIELADEALEMIDDLPDAAYDFGESVKEKLTDIRSSIIQHNRVSDKQRQAIENMAAGIGRWVRD